MFANTVCFIIKLELIIEKPDTTNRDNQSKGLPNLLLGYARLDYTLVCLSRNEILKLCLQIRIIC